MINSDMSSPYCGGLLDKVKDATQRVESELSLKSTNFSYSTQVEVGH
jgi:hypothetical protein